MAKKRKKSQKTTFRTVPTMRAADEVGLFDAWDLFETGDMTGAGKAIHAPTSGLIPFAVEQGMYRMLRKVAGPMPLFAFGKYRVTLF